MPSLFVIVFLLIVLLLTFWAIVYQLVKQQGRLLLRVDQIEQRLMTPQLQGLPRPTIGGYGHNPPHASDSSKGLPVGSQIEPFQLADIFGRTVALEELRGSRTLLVHWNPGCGYCVMIAPDLAKLEDDVERAGTKLLLVSSGSPEINQQMAKRYGLTSSILLQNGDALTAFQGLGTPVAYLLDEQGRVAKPLASGAGRVPGFIREAIDNKPRRKLPGERGLRESRLMRDGIKPGTPAPEFTLRSVHGEDISLSAYRGRQVLLVFSDPRCAPCNDLVPQLSQLQHATDDSNSSIVLVGRGSMEENRQKAAQNGLTFPVVVQEGWKLSKEYGIFATPVAFLIEPNGVIGCNVARGTKEILALARGQMGVIGVPDELRAV